MIITTSAFQFLDFEILVLQPHASNVILILPQEKFSKDSHIWRSPP